MLIRFHNYYRPVFSSVLPFVFATLLVLRMRGTNISKKTGKYQQYDRYNFPLAATAVKEACWLLRQLSFGSIMGSVAAVKMETKNRLKWDLFLKDINVLLQE